MVDKDMMEAIQKAVHKAISEELDRRLAPIMTTLDEIKALHQAIRATSARTDVVEQELGTVKATLACIERSLEDSDARLNDFVKEVIPAMAQHQADVAMALSMQVLDVDVHRRKWNLILQGVKGEAKEPEEQTRATCVEFAKNKLQLQNVAAADFSACHRMAQKKDAAIILRFVDLSQRNAWIANSKNLAGNTSISISPDLPPVLRSLKTELLNQRRTLPDDIRKFSRIRYLPQWPYVELKQPGEMDPLRPASTKLSVVSAALGKLNPLLNLQRIMRDAQV